MILQTSLFDPKSAGGLRQPSTPAANPHPTRQLHFAKNTINRWLLVGPTVAISYFDLQMLTTPSWDRLGTHFHSIYVGDTFSKPGIIGERCENQK